MSNPPPVIQLLQFYLTGLRIELPSGGKGQATRKEELSIDLNMGESLEEKGVWRLDLHATLHPAITKSGSPQPLIEARIMGLFAVPPEMEECQRNLMLPYNGGLILYGILRGQIAATTGSLPGGKVMLPSVNWTQVIQDIALKQLAKANTPHVQKKKGNARDGLPGKAKYSPVSK